jgi:hypothetical protein
MVSIVTLGCGCRQIQAVYHPDGEVIVAVWQDGRIATLRGLRTKAHRQFGVTLHREQGFQSVNLSVTRKSYYASLLEAIMRSLPHGKSDIPQEQTLELIRFLEAGNESRRTRQPVLM